MDGVAIWDVACERQVEVTGADGKTPVMAKNTLYWVGPDMIVSKGAKNRYRDWGRNWDLSGQRRIRQDRLAKSQSTDESVNS